jgi:alpha-D-xyloside xylohydrolase
MLKHLPEGLTPWEDGGFSRNPQNPLAGQEVIVSCRSDYEVPALYWELDGKMMPVITGVPAGNNCYRFTLGVFDKLSAVSYRFAAGNNRTRVFNFDVLKEVTLCEPLTVLRRDKSLKVRFAHQITLELDWQKGISLKLLREDKEPEGQAFQSFCESLGEDYELEAQSSPFICLLKRLSKPVFQIDLPIVIRVDGKGNVHSASQPFRLLSNAVYGLGEKFNGVNQKGRRVLCRVVEKFTHQGEQTYLPVPFFFTENGIGCLCKTSRDVEMDFTGEAVLTQGTPPSGLLTEFHLFLGKPGRILKQLHEQTGAPLLPPAWAFGLWISANGWNNDREVEAQLEALKRYDYPATVMVLEAWSDERTFYLWNDTAHWQNPEKTVKAVREAGLHLVLWQIPIIKYEWDGEPGKQLLSDEEFAIQNGYCVMQADGTPYRITEKWFHNSLLLDFTNPEAVKWWFSKREYLLKMGVEGFKTDGGEFLFDRDCRLFDGSRGVEAHNLYPNQYIGAYRDFMNREGVEGVLFSRAGFSGAQTMPIHWAGDQLSLWSELKEQLSAGLSAGLSGIPFWSFDIGGFAGEMPSKELYLRATALAAFCPVMQWHAEPRKGQFEKTYGDTFINDRSPWNMARQLGDEEILAVAVAFAKKRMEMHTYLYGEARHCAETSRPMMAHLIYDFPDDENVYGIEDEFMLGRRLLVAPLIDEGQSERVIYLPHGKWRDIYLHADYEGGGCMTYVCPLDRIPVFERMDA